MEWLHCDQEDLKFWFVKLEAFFLVYNIEDEQERANIAVTHLDKNLHLLIKDIVTDESIKNPYSCLKNRLLKIYYYKLENKLRHAVKKQLENIDHPLEPLEILDVIIESGKKQMCSEYMLKSIFYDHLPKPCQDLLPNFESCDEDLQELGKIADEIVKTINPLTDETTALKLELKKAKKQIDVLKKRIGYLEKTKSSLRSRSRSIKRNKNSFTGKKKSRFYSDSDDDYNRSYTCSCDTPCHSYKEHLDLVIRPLFYGNK